MAIVQALRLRSSNQTGKELAELAHDRKMQTEANTSTTSNYIENIKSRLTILRDLRSAIEPNIMRNSFAENQYSITYKTQIDKIFGSITDGTYLNTAITFAKARSKELTELILNGGQPILSKTDEYLEKSLSSELHKSSSESRSYSILSEVDKRLRGMEENLSQSSICNNPNSEPDSVFITPSRL